MAAIPAALAECDLRKERVPPDLRIAEVDQTRNVAPGEGIQHPTRQLHVFLPRRHQPGKLQRMKVVGIE